MNKFCNFKTASDNNDENVLILNGTIVAESWYSDDVTLKMFRDELNTYSGDITVWINSPSGDCFAASEIYTMLKEHEGQITVKIDDIAANAASVIVMAGDIIEMSPTAMIMIHNPAMLLIIGNSVTFQRNKKHIILNIKSRTALIAIRL